MDWWLFGLVWSVETALVIGVRAVLERTKDRQS